MTNNKSSAQQLIEQGQLFLTKEHLTDWHCWYSENPDTLISNGVASQWSASPMYGAPSPGNKPCIVMFLGYCRVVDGPLRTTLFARFLWEEKHMLLKINFETRPWSYMNSNARKNFYLHGDVFILQVLTPL
ncbi:MAG: hypothetical protein WC761_02090 [Candidatus Paceibacterota bacterium]|jgi:hypothetical protein